MADRQKPKQQEMNTVHVTGLDLPPGFRFHPSDYEIVSHYLMNKVRSVDTAFEEVDLKKTEPWDLPIKAKWGEKEWYFFYQKDRKYTAGLRANRATRTGYWKATGRDREIYNTTEGVLLLVGMKKTLVFYKGRAPRGDKTNWVMHEYRLEGSGRLLVPASASSSATNSTVAMKASSSACKDEWVVCRVFEKAIEIKKITEQAYQVAMADAEINQNQNNIPAIPIPMPLQQPLPTSIIPIPPDFATDSVPPYYYPNGGGAGMLPMMPPMAGIGGVGRLQINDAMFGNPIVTPPQVNLYHQMGMGATAGQMGMGTTAGQMDKGVVAGQTGMGGVVAQMDMGVASADSFDVAALESRPSSMVSQKDKQDI